MPSAKSVDEYLASLPPDRRAAIASVRAVIVEHLPAGYEEGIQYGMIGYYVPHRRYPAGYHANPKEPLPFVSLGSQKGHMALYLTCVLGDPEQGRWFAEEHRKTGKKLDMGKSCVRFKKLEDLPLELVGRAVARVPVDAYLAKYEAQLEALGKGKSAKPKAAARRRA